MPKKRHEPEEIAAKLRRVDMRVSQGQSVADAIGSIGVTGVSCCRWRREFGSLKSDQVRRMKKLEAENARLRRAVADLTLDKPILKSPLIPTACAADRSCRHCERSEAIQGRQSATSPRIASSLRSSQ